MTFATLRPPYSVIYADPPWHYRDRANDGARGAEHKYPVMSPAELAALPVRELAAKDCALCMWVTYPQLAVGLDLIRAWGFRYSTGLFTWVKSKKSKKAGPGWIMGMGHYSRSNAELCLLSVRGAPKVVCRSVQQIIDTPRGRHSEKPAVARERIVQLFGDVPRVELFARIRPPGWDVWGNEVGE
jgi:N6-adenosine-specific RNA methylase IME4